MIMHRLEATNSHGAVEYSIKELTPGHGRLELMRPTRGRMTGISPFGEVWLCFPNWELIVSLHERDRPEEP